MRRGRVCGKSGRRHRGRIDIDAGGRNRVYELAARAGRELHRGCCRGAGEQQASLWRCAGRSSSACSNHVGIAAVGGGCGIIARAVIASGKRGEQRAQHDACKRPAHHVAITSLSVLSQWPVQSPRALATPIRPKGLGLRQRLASHSVCRRHCLMISTGRWPRRRAASADRTPLRQCVLQRILCRGRPPG